MLLLSVVLHPRTRGHHPFRIPLGILKEAKKVILLNVCGHKHRAVQCGYQHNSGSYVHADDLANVSKKVASVGLCRIWDSNSFFNALTWATRLHLTIVL